MKHKKLLCVFCTLLLLLSIFLLSCENDGQTPTIPKTEQVENKGGQSTTGENPGGLTVTEDNGNFGKLNPLQ